MYLRLSIVAGSPYKVTMYMVRSMVPTRGLHVTDPLLEKSPSQNDRLDAVSRLGRILASTEFGGAPPLPAATTTFELEAPYYYLITLLGIHPPRFSSVCNHDRRTWLS